MPQYLTFHGFSLPFCLRRSDIGLLPSKVVYCTQSLNSWTVPLPTLPDKYGSVPISSHMSRKLCVPKLLSSVTPPHQRLTMVGRLSFGPIPSFQWYESAKQPPGHRRFGIINFFRASTTSLRTPFVCFIFVLFSPT